VNQADNQAHIDQVRAAQCRIEHHPAFKEHKRIEGLALTLDAVFDRNLRDLLALLNAAATDQDLAIELVQNVRPPAVREEFIKRTVRCIHNCVASATTLVDHTRAMMRDRSDPLTEEFARRKSEMLAHDEIPFVQDLRNFTLHRELPLLGHQVQFGDSEGAELRSEVRLSAAQLLEWSKWTARSRSFISDRGPDLELRPIIRHHGRIVWELNAWLVNALGAANAAGLDEVNRLGIELNAILSGTDLATAERMTRRWPEPPPIAE
jgi:hypothetical protein